MPRGVRPVGSLVRNKWRITSVLRAGTAAALYFASTRSGGIVPLKIIHPHLASDQRLRARLLAEGDIAHVLEHNGAVRVLDEDEADDGAALLLLEPLDGETLETRRLRLGGVLALEDVFDVAELLLDLLRAAHEKGVFQFEVTPNNLFLTDTGLLKILDFGALEGRPRTPLERERVTVIWPAAYTAPELLLDEASDARSDIWAVGALLYTLVTGTTTRPHDMPPESVASVPARSLKESALQLPRAFVNIVDRALEFDRADRWPDVAAMQQALRWARRSLEGGWGQDEKATGAVPLDLDARALPGELGSGALGPRVTRSSLADQARLARQRAVPVGQTPSSPPATGATPVDPSLTLLNRLREDAKKRPKIDFPTQTEDSVTTLSIERAPAGGSPADGTRGASVTHAGGPGAVLDEGLADESGEEVGAGAPIRLKPRRASEPTLPSAAIAADAAEDAALESASSSPAQPSISVVMGDPSRAPAGGAPGIVLPPVTTPPRKAEPSVPPRDAAEDAASSGMTGVHGYAPEASELHDEVPDSSDEPDTLVRTESSPSGADVVSSAASPASSASIESLVNARTGDPQAGEGRADAVAGDTAHHDLPLPPASFASPLVTAPASESAPVPAAPSSSSLSRNAIFASVVLVVIAALISLLHRPEESAPAEIVPGSSASAFEQDGATSTAPSAATAETSRAATDGEPQAANDGQTGEADSSVADATDLDADADRSPAGERSGLEAGVAPAHPDGAARSAPNPNAAPLGRPHLDAATP